MKSVDIVGWLAVAMAMLLSGTFIDQIRLNLAGNPGSIVVPVGLFLNCLLWSAYSMLLPKRDWKIFIPNFTGAIVAVVNFATVLWGPAIKTFF